MQFLIEAVVLSSFGGLVGILLGLSAAAIGAYVLEVPFILNTGIAIIAFLFSAAVGALFGFSRPVRPPGWIPSMPCAMSDVGNTLVFAIGLLDIGADIMNGVRSVQA